MVCEEPCKEVVWEQVLGNLLSLSTIHDLQVEFASQKDEEENMEAGKMPGQRRWKGLNNRTSQNKN